MNDGQDGAVIDRQREPGGRATDVDDGAPSGARTRSASRTRRPGEALRQAAEHGLAGPVVVAVYALLSWGDGNRGAILAVAAVLTVTNALLWLGADHLARSPLRWTVSMAGVLVQLAGYAGLSYLDGGVASPLGALVYVSLPFLAVTSPRRPFAVFTAIAVALYWAVALAGGPAPPGYAVGFTLVFVFVSMLCFRHATALASLRRRLTEVSRVDPLTGCLNRRGFDERLQQELSKAARSGEPISLLLIDLDRFKEVNDTYGHSVGDELLSWTGRTLRQTARADDAVGRLGGDEFAVILTGATGEDIAAAVGRLRTALGHRSPGQHGGCLLPGRRHDRRAPRTGRRWAAVRGQGPPRRSPHRSGATDRHLPVGHGRTRIGVAP